MGSRHTCVGNLVCLGKVFCVDVLATFQGSKSFLSSDLILDNLSSLAICDVAGFESQFGKN